MFIFIEIPIILSLLYSELLLLINKRKVVLVEFSIYFGCTIFIYLHNLNLLYYLDSYNIIGMGYNALFIYY